MQDKRKGGGGGGGGKVGGGTQPSHQSGECGVGGRVRVARWGSVVMSSDALSDG